jgi:opacity protein-like surface antigen
MARAKSLAAACVGAVAFIATAHAAHAADVPGGWSPPLPEFETPKLPVTELMSGWYLRGDIGYRYNRVGSVDASAPVVSQEYGDILGAGLGVGYKYQWFRADLTIDYGAESTIRGTTATAAAQPQYTDRVDAVSGLANVYFDLGTWAGFTPYVGAGAGASYLRSRDYANTALPPGTKVDPSTKVNFAWAWMAGVSFQLTPSWLIDVGYRHLDLGDVFSHAGGISGPVNDLTTWKKLSTEEIRIGARLLFD